MANEWFYQVMGVTEGPVSPSELRRLAQEGRIDSSTLIRKGVDGDWMYADRVKGLFEPGPAQPPPIPKGEWYFSRAGEKTVSVSFTDLQRLRRLAAGKLPANG